MFTKAERDDLFSSVDLRQLTGQRVPNSPRRAVRVTCPVHGGENDLAIFPDHAYCFSTKCGWRGGAYDTAAILLGYWSKTDPLWPSKHFDAIISKLRSLKFASGAQAVVDALPAPTEAELTQMLWDALPGDPSMETTRSKVDKWRGWPAGTAQKYSLAVTERAIMIPVFRSDGKLLTIRYRVRPKFEAEGKPKYWGTAGINSENYVYGAYTQPPNKGRALVLVEGEFDTISSQLAGVPTLSFINGAGWKDGREKVLAKMLDRFEYILVAYDQDDAGQRGIYGYTNHRGNRVPGIMDNVVDTSKVVPVVWDTRSGKDPNEFIKQQGVESWRELMVHTLRSHKASLSQPKKRSQTDMVQSRPSSARTAAYRYS